MLLTETPIEAYPLHSPLLGIAPGPLTRGVYVSASFFGVKPSGIHFRVGSLSPPP